MRPRPAPAVVLLLAALLLAAPPTAGAAESEVPESEAPAGGGESDGAVAVLETSLGTLVFRLFEDEAPRTVAQFERLVREGFYDGLPFYRVVAGHVIQAGDGGENDQPTVPLEPGAHPHVAGALGLARDTDPHSGSTEIYVCLEPRPHLDGEYTVFGLLTEGYDVLRQIGAVEVDERWVGDDGDVAFHEPKEPVLIETARIEAGAGSSP